MVFATATKAPRPFGDPLAGYPRLNLAADPRWIIDSTNICKAGRARWACQAG